MRRRVVQIKPYEYKFCQETKMTLAEVEAEVEARLARPHSGTSTWAQLVRSARRLQGDGCDGHLLDEAVKCGLGLLAGTPHCELAAIWRETDNALMQEEPGEPVREEMLGDIEVQLYESLCERVCEQARGLRKGGRTKGQSDHE